jgi:phage replication initiation protein
MNRTIVDWLGFRSRTNDIPGVASALKKGFGAVGNRVGLLRQPDQGWMGYKSTAVIHLDGMRVGRIAYGGEMQKGWAHVDITGAGCQWVEDWSGLQDGIGDLPEFEVRRCDIALDTFKREVTFDSVVNAYERGAFQRGGGRPPKIQKITGGDERDGRTVYIGKRDQAKFFRGYEKGRQLAMKSPPGVMTHIDGVPVGDWFRLEVELKVKQAALPVDLIDRRDQYFAGCYPYLSAVLEVEPEVFVQRREREPQIELEGALANIRRQYGSTLFTALAAHQGDFLRVWERIVGRKHNQTLIEAGVLLVDHSE